MSEKFRNKTTKTKFLLIYIFFLRKNFVTSAHFWRNRSNPQSSPFSYVWNAVGLTCGWNAWLTRIITSSQMIDGIRSTNWFVLFSVFLGRNYSKFNKVLWFRRCWCCCWFLEKLRIWLNVKWWKLACHVGLFGRGWWWINCFAYIFPFLSAVQSLLDFSANAN